MVLKNGEWPSRLLSASRGGRRRCHPRGHRTSCSRKMAVVDISQRRWRRRRQGCECAQFSPRCPHSSVCSFHPSPHRRKEKWLSATFDWHRALRTGNSCSLQSLVNSGNGPISGIMSIADGHGDVKPMLQGERKSPLLTASNPTSTNHDKDASHTAPFVQQAALARRSCGGASVGSDPAILTGCSPSSPSQRSAAGCPPR